MSISNQPPAHRPAAYGVAVMMSVVRNGLIQRLRSLTLIFVGFAMNISSRFSLALLTISLCWIACEKPQQKLVGKWNGPGGSWSEFYNDGTAQLNDGAGVTIGAKYGFLQNGRMKMETTFLGTHSVFTFAVTFDDDTVTFTDLEHGGKKVYTRFKE